MGNGTIALGIDLGTTNSVVAVVNEQGVPEVIPNSEGERLTPSSVHFDGDNIVVGQFARDALRVDPDNVVMFVKRQIGNPTWHVQYDGKEHTAIDVSALILEKLRKDAEQALNMSINYAVITVPADFDDARRRATETAATIAGMKVLCLINEPTAAAIAFGANRKGDKKTVLVYDLGGGTFDVTLMMIEGDKIRVLATEGQQLLGGKDFDDLIIKYAVQAFQAEHGFDPTAEEYVAAELREQAEKAKRELSKRSSTILVIGAKGRTTRTSLTKEQLDEFISSKVDNTFIHIRNVLEHSKLAPEDVDQVILVGGSTRLRIVREKLAEFFGKDPDASINPDEAVALGAAIVAARELAEIEPEALSETVHEVVGGLQVSDVLSHSLGIGTFVPGTNRPFNSIMLARNTPIPKEESRIFPTTTANQTAIKITIYQGEFDDPSLCNPVGEFLLKGLPPNRPVGKKVRITISCNTNGMVEVQATDIETGLQAETVVNYSQGLSQDEIADKQSWLKKKTKTIL
ncbi:MAG: hypothetical protein CL607_04390 [Anaerolineaceae bacterium]|nr:hypothetical protein [Anaerolineaceae bacterium]